MHFKNAFLFIFLIASASLVCLIIMNEEDKRKHVSSSSSNSLNSLNSLPSTKLWVNHNTFSNNELFIYENESSSM